MEYAEQIWTEFSSQFAPAVKEVVEFAKQIPQFMELEEDDQVQLMKSGAFEVSIGGLEFDIDDLVEFWDIRFFDPSKQRLKQIWNLFPGN